MFAAPAATVAFMLSKYMYVSVYHPPILITAGVVQLNNVVPQFEVHFSAQVLLLAVVAVLTVLFCLSYITFSTILIIIFTFEWLVIDWKCHVFMLLYVSQAPYFFCRTLLTWPLTDAVLPQFNATSPSSHKPPPYPNALASPNYSTPLLNASKDSGPPLPSSLPASVSHGGTSSPRVSLAEPGTTAQWSCLPHSVWCGGADVHAGRLWCWRETLLSSGSVLTWGNRTIYTGDTS